MIGTIKNWISERGFGFIWTEAGEFFFHETDVLGEVRRGDPVSFWLDDDERRGNLRAVEVQRVNASPRFQAIPQQQTTPADDGRAVGSL